jgi:hypothetical protein
MNASLQRLLRLLLLPAAVALGAPSGAAAQLSSPFAGVPEITEYRMTRPGLDAFMRVARALHVLEEEGLEIGAGLEGMDEEDITVDVMVAALDGEPAVRGAIEAAGVNTRDFVVFMMAMMHTMMSAQALDLGDDGVDGLPAGVLRDNIRFFLDNQDAFLDLEG